MKLILLYLYLSTFFLISCGKKMNTESSPTAGEISIYCDVSLKSIVEQEEQIFERNYPLAKINIQYLNENELYKGFINDSLEIIIATRDLDSTLLEYLDKVKNLHPRIFPFAVTANAFICSHKSIDTILTFENIIDALQGQGLLKDKKFIIENKSSGIARTLIEMGALNQLPSNFFAVNNLDSVIDYVSNHSESIGIIDWSRVSDSDDPIAQKYLSKINLIKISRPIDSLQKGYVPPFQYHLQDHIYPFTKTISVISRSGKSDLGLGFASFITGEIGQRIILKAGLLPLYQTDRWIELKSTGNIKVVQ